MCNCITELTKSVCGDNFRGQRIRHATFTKPYIRLTLPNKRVTVPVDLPFCPVCGQEKHPGVKN